MVRQPTICLPKSAIRSLSAKHLADRRRVGPASKPRFPPGLFRARMVVQIIYEALGAAGAVSAQPNVRINPVAAGRTASRSAIGNTGIRS
jgi:hypothetical protein